MRNSELVANKIAGAMSVTDREMRDATG